MQKVIHWFRQDLRLDDNPALFDAACHGKVLPVYILDDTHAGVYFMGAASRWWLHHALLALDGSLQGHLRVYRGNPADILLAMAKDNGVHRVYWNRCYEPWQIKRDKAIKKLLEAHHIEVKSYNGFLLWEPLEVLKQDGTPYKVFTPYYRNGCLTPPRAAISKPLPCVWDDANHSTAINDLKLLSTITFQDSFKNHWQVGAAAAHQRLDAFVSEGLKGYKEGRNFPYKSQVSKLSPYLHFGQLSPHYVWYRLQCSKGLGYDEDVDHFCSELGWREFAYYLLYYFPNLPKQNLNPKFDTFPWSQAYTSLTCWQSGQTGIPIVDAGMRQLLQTGYIHNRVRMIVASFLVKNLRLHWHHGERWFWDHLVDADLANNSASWQWVAGCGADAAPYFRIFNPVTQGQKFDPMGTYTREFVPELRNIPDEYLFNPWEAPENMLHRAGITLGKDYPRPIVDLKQSRHEALEAFAVLKRTSL
ncbi:MAG: DNA photolyase family protein [Amoebophilaceae bacterium]|nr:DNA photolyase family protein [Amoebophilaceae bacterium]